MAFRAIRQFGEMGRMTGRKEFVAESGQVIVDKIKPGFIGLGQTLKNLVSQGFVGGVNTVSRLVSGDIFNQSDDLSRAS